MTTTAVKTSLKWWIWVLSNFIASIDFVIKIACVASVSSRVIARTLEREQLDQLVRKRLPSRLWSKLLLCTFITLFSTFLWRPLHDYHVRMTTREGRALGYPGTRLSLIVFRKKSVFLIGPFKFPRERVNLQRVWRFQNNSRAQAE